MHNPRLVYALNQIVRVMCALSIVILVGFEAVPVTTESDAQYINQADLQRTCSQIFAKSVYALKYRSDGERTQAISDLQIMLPQFEQEQTVLLVNTASDVQNTMQVMQPDYLALVTAVQAILNHPNAANSINVDIVLTHERSYLLASSNLMALLQRHADEHKLQLFWIKAFIEALLEFLVILSIFITRRMAELTQLTVEHAESNGHEESNKKEDLIGR